MEFFLKLHYNREKYYLPNEQNSIVEYIRLKKGVQMATGGQHLLSPRLTCNTRLSKMAAQCDRSLKTGNECIETRHQRPDQNKHLPRIERSTCQSLGVLLLHPL